MAFQVRWTPNAEEDYKSGVAYLAKEWSFDIALDFMDKTEKRIDTLSYFPYLGIASNNLPEVRSSSTKHNRLYYRVSNEQLNYFPFLTQEEIT